MATEVTYRYGAFVYGPKINKSWTGLDWDGLLSVIETCEANGWEYGVHAVPTDG